MRGAGSWDSSTVRRVVFCVPPPSLGIERIPPILQRVSCDFSGSLPCCFVRAISFSLFCLSAEYHLWGVCSLSFSGEPPCAKFNTLRYLHKLHIFLVGLDSRKSHLQGPPLSVKNLYWSLVFSLSATSAVVLCYSTLALVQEIKEVREAGCSHH